MKSLFWNTHPNLLWGKWNVIDFKHFIEVLNSWFTLFALYVWEHLTASLAYTGQGNKKSVSLLLLRGSSMKKNLFELGNHTFLGIENMKQISHCAYLSILIKSAVKSRTQWITKNGKQWGETLQLLRTLLSVAWSSSKTFSEVQLQSKKEKTKNVTLNIPQIPYRMLCWV